MTDIVYREKSKRLLLAWVPEVLFHPRQAFQRISSYSGAVWLTPLFIVSCLVLINVLLGGRLKNQAALAGEITYPPDYQYYTPDQQAQYMQAIQSTQSPVFVYVLPAIIALLGVWFGWLILGGLLHLITTLFGGRGSTLLSMNIVAWASLPLAVRQVIQIIYMLITQKLITNPGLSGFSPTGNTGLLLFIGHFLKYIDIYIIWQILLLILVVRLSTGLNKTKALIGVIITVLLMILAQAGLSYLASVLSNLNITRPFFF
jgi:hypothetical protein